MPRYRWVLIALSIPLIACLADSSRCDGISLPNHEIFNAELCAEKVIVSTYRLVDDGKGVGDIYSIMSDSLVHLKRIDGVQSYRIWNVYGELFRLDYLENPNRCMLRHMVKLGEDYIDHDVIQVWGDIGSVSGNDYELFIYGDFGFRDSADISRRLIILKRPSNTVAQEHLLEEVGIQHMRWVKDALLVDYVDYSEDNKSVRKMAWWRNGIFNDIKHDLTELFLSSHNHVSVAIAKFGNNDGGEMMIIYSSDSTQFIKINENLKLDYMLADGAKFRLIGIERGVKDSIWVNQYDIENEIWSRSYSSYMGRISGAVYKSDTLTLTGIFRNAGCLEKNDIVRISLR